ncbi:hypothetical protein NCCP2495_16780 [Dietzia sp. NCCP-2495]|nr:hypothetical protein NCCP2495_16780 [Dietzia sp. NCCP-2495]
MPHEGEGLDGEAASLGDSGRGVKRFGWHRATPSFWSIQSLVALYANFSLGWGQVQPPATISLFAWRADTTV